MKQIPVLHVQGTTLAEAYEKALIELYKNGISIQTQYDKEGEPLSIDCTMNITVDEPLTDPMIHKAFPGGIADLREYLYELMGRKDHWVKNINDPDDTRWEYTYHGRIADWGSWYEKDEKGRRVHRTLSSSADSGAEGKEAGINQIQQVIEKLSSQPFSRQAQVITWMPPLDFAVYDPPCLQSIWYRLTEDDEAFRLNTNVRFRSNDAWGANFMNMFGFTLFNRDLIADPLSERLNKKVTMGRMNWQADSYHLYGKDQKDFKERFWDRLKRTDFVDRVYYFHDDMIQEIWEEADAEVLKKITDYEKRTGQT